MMRSIIALSAAMTMICGLSCADTIVKNDGTEMKGVVVEEYGDRVVFSTVDGEIGVMKSDIRSMSFDDEESNLLKLASIAKEGDDQARALAYYEKALAVNPQSKAAREGRSLLQMQSWQKEKNRKLADLEKQAEIDMYGAPKPREPEADSIAQLKERLEAEMGIALASEGSLPVVTRVKDGSSASVAGVERGDRIVAVWGRLTGYLSFKDVVNLLLKRSSMEVRCTVERVAKVAVNPNRTLTLPPDLIGASLGIGPEGLTLMAVKKGGAAESSGLVKGDLVTAIDGNSTRYLQLGKAVNLIKGADGDHVKLTFRRDVIIWKGG